MSHSLLSRRRFLAATANAGALLLTPAIVPSTVLGRDGAVAANERIALAGIGINVRGQVDLESFAESPLVQFVAIADVRQDRRDAVGRWAKQKYGCNVDAYRDFREMLPRKDIDAVLIATGDRWHAVASIYAAKAGKDIYCEKPCTMTIAESLALADAVRRYGVIFQGGTQRRSVANYLHAIDLYRTGKLGKLKAVHANTLQPITWDVWEPKQPEPPRDVLDWDLWLGPAPWRPYNQKYIDGEWRWIFDMHGGGFLEWGAHTVDLCNWAATNDQEYPVSYMPMGSGLIAKYASGLKLYMRDRGWLGLGDCAIRLEGEEGWVETGDSGRLVLALGKHRSSQQFEERCISPTNHVFNFLESVQTRKPPCANADIVAHSHIICHAAYTAAQLHRSLRFDPQTMDFLGDEEASRMRSRAYREPWRI